MAGSVMPFMMSSGRPQAAPTAASADNWDAVSSVAQAPSPAPAQAGPSAGNWDAVSAPAESTLSDIGKSAVSGAARGAVETAMTVPTLGRLANTAADYTIDPMLRGAENLGREAFGYPQVTAEDYAKRRAAVSDTGNLDKVVNQAQDSMRGVMNPMLHTPQTVAGRYTDAAAQFLPALLGGGGGPGILSRLAADVALPSAVSETAGHAAAGTPYEPVARLMGALLGHGVTGVARSAIGAPSRYMATATEGADPAAWDRARQLAQGTRDQFGFQISGPEALQQVTNNSTDAADLMRLVESTRAGAAVTKPFFAQRTGDIGTAVGRELNTLGPEAQQPAMLGPRAQAAAERGVSGIRRDINTGTDPLYQTAAATPLAPQAMQELARNPLYRQAAETIRNDPSLAPAVRGMADDSTDFVDYVTRYMNQQGRQFSNPGGGAQGDNLRAQQWFGAAQDARNLATDPNRGGSAAYGQALQTQAAGRAAELDPARAAPLGQMAAPNLTTEQARGVLMPGSPSEGAANEMPQLMRALTGAPADPTIGADLTRNTLGTLWNDASTRLQSGPNQNVGAAFAKRVAGNPERAQVLNSVVSGAAGPTVADRWNNLMQALQATGTRQNVGSRTAFNAEDLKALGGSVLREGGATMGVGVPRLLGDLVSRAMLAGRMRQLGGTMIGPNAIDAMQTMAQRGAASAPSVLFRQGQQNLLRQVGGLLGRGGQ